MLSEIVKIDEENKNKFQIKYPEKANTELTQIHEYEDNKGHWFYKLKIKDHDVLVLDYYHPSYRITYLLKYYGLMGLYQMALNNIYLDNDNFN